MLYRPRQARYQAALRPDNWPEKEGKSLCARRFRRINGRITFGDVSPSYSTVHRRENPVLNRRSSILSRSVSDQGIAASPRGDGWRRRWLADMETLFDGVSLWTSEEH